MQDESWNWNCATNGETEERQRRGAAAEERVSTETTHGCKGQEIMVRVNVQQVVGNITAKTLMVKSLIVVC